MFLGHNHGTRIRFVATFVLWVTCLHEILGSAPLRRTFIVIFDALYGVFFLEAFREGILRQLEANVVPKVIDSSKT